MKIFISWSGARSKAVAEVLDEWIKCVIQAARPWVSTQNIDRGAIWFNEIQTQLQDTSIGIVCLTNENKNKPWILFESGALAKGLSASRVCTFLVDLYPADVENPLAQFNHTLPDQESMWQLVRTLNSCLPADQMLSHQVLERTFLTYWPQFTNEFRQALDDNGPAVDIPERAEKDILSEILENTRSLSNRVNTIETSLKNQESSQTSSKFLRRKGNNVYISKDGKMVPISFDPVEDAIAEFRSKASKDIMDQFVVRNSDPEESSS
ncbi:toll/interleukin-1 receptor domain-containing protein [Burkholderia cenocepacia]|uniref:toll-Interleukin receptor n=1 Tax=Burkholderia cenocepacia TaxID=95486 RepID=UPI0028601312|nr:toll-Interleukin receptor [Burkholderia cenocepacia]MDR8105520.1 toll/interleukin-1 receptor domain-containing protein [Burkholderia cenocepacia]